jgi:hypothetical protein
MIKNVCDTFALVAHLMRREIHNDEVEKPTRIFTAW